MRLPAMLWSGYAPIMYIYIYANNIQINSSHDTHPGDEPLVSPVAVTEVLEDRGAALLSVVNLFLFS